MKSGVSILIAILALSGCKGPAQKAGEQRDKEAAATAGVAYNGSGPNEAVGRQKDRAVEAVDDAKHATAKALREQADQIRALAEVDAKRLDEQAKSIRSEADGRADKLDEQAKQALQSR